LGQFHKLEYGLKKLPDLIGNWFMGFYQLLRNKSPPNTQQT